MARLRRTSSVLETTRQRLAGQIITRAPDYEMVGGARLSERKKPKVRGAGGTTPPTA